MTRLTFPLLLLALAGCTERRQEPMEHHDPLAVEIRGLERETGDGPYVAGATETFKLVTDEGVQSVRWSATSGALNASGDRARWKLPEPGAATISATIVTRSGEEKSASWSFQVVSPSDTTGRAREALLAAPIPVLDGGSAGETGEKCELRYDSANNIHLAFTNDTHPSLWYGYWNGSTWSIQLVDGMGFNTGGQVVGRIGMVIDSANNPHLVYSLLNKGLWYATKSGATWTRERVDTSVPSNMINNVSIALNPAQANRPTIAYVTDPSYERLVVAARTGVNTWTNTTLTFSFTAYAQWLVGDMLIDAAGKMYFPMAGFTYLGSWDGVTATDYNLNVSWDADWASASWAGAGKILLRTRSTLVEVTVGSPVYSSTKTVSQVESAGSPEGDVAYSSKPHLLHLHGSNLELVTPNAQGYWTYTQLGTATSGTSPSLAVTAAGVASICYQTAGRITFQ